MNSKQGETRRGRRREQQQHHHAPRHRSLPSATSSSASVAGRAASDVGRHARSSGERESREHITHACSLDANEID